MIESGTVAPDFTLEGDQGESVTLSKLRGKKVILDFYPKDDTPGCTIQACDFRDAMPQLEGVKAVVLGVSPDSVKSHAKFRAKFDLTFHFSRMKNTQSLKRMVYGRRRRCTVALTWGLSEALS